MMTNDDDRCWQVLKEETVIARPWLHATRYHVLLPTGKEHKEYYVLHYPTWVNIIAETTNGELVLVRQYRHGLRIMSTELCAGIAEEGETPLQAAQRELREETGYEGGTWQEFLRVAPNPGTMDNYSYTFLAQGVVRTAQRHLDETEDVQCFTKPKHEVYTMLRNGIFLQALMVAPLWKYFAAHTLP